MADDKIKNASDLDKSYQKLQEVNAKLLEEINKHVKTEEQLQEKSSTLKTIFESIQIGIVIINPETHRIVYANPAAVKLIRAPRDKIVGAECHKFICPAEKGKCPVTDLGQNVDNSERILITADWEERPIIKTVVHINIGGREHLLESFIDITERKLAEEALKKSTEDWNRTFDSISDLIFIQDNNFVILRANKAFCNALKSKPEDIIGKKCYELLHKTNSPWPNCPFEKTKRDQEAHTEEVDDKNIGIPLLVTTSPIFNEKGELIGSVHTAKDISEHKEAEKKLLESEQRIRLLLNSTGEAIYGIDLQGNCTFANPSCLKMLGYQNIEQLLGKNMHKLIHHSYPDGSPMPVEICRIYKAFRAGKGEHSDDEVLWKADGTSFPAEYWSYPQIIDGKVHGAVVTFTDITERKKSEEELAFKNAILSTQQETSIDGILVVDGKGKIISFNQRFIDMWGISPEIIESQSDELALQAVLKEVADPIPFLTKVRYLYEHYNDTSRDEILLNDGRTFDRYSAPMFGDKGKYYGRVWYFRDITDHKQAEEKLIELSLMDELTGLNNRRGFSILAAKQIKNADRYKHGLTLIYIDLDNMKWINDNLGHKEGDLALMDISNIFKKSFRSSDIIGRLGGDEFAGLVVDSRGTTSDMILTRMQESINELNSQKTRSYNLSISFGAISYDNENPCSLNELLERGDKAMYAHKQKKGVRRGEKN